MVVRHLDLAEGSDFEDEDDGTDFEGSDFKIP